MNQIWTVLTILLFLTSCKSSTTMTDKSIQKQQCPTDGICTFEVLKDQQILILEDEFKNSYHQLKKADGKTVLKYEYKKNQDPTLADDSYSEIVFVEIDKELDELELEGKDLRRANVSFGRLCFCRGATGFYKVKKGKLKITRVNKGYEINLEFKVDEVPQVITSFSESFEL